MAQSMTIDRLLSGVADTPENVLEQLRQNPELASGQDAHGYSLVHAAASYGHTELLRALVKELGVDINIVDEDGETALFNVETPDMARELIDLDIDVDKPNDEGQTAAEKLEDEDEQPAVAAFLRQRSSQQVNGSTDPTATDVNNLPPMPNGMNISIGTMQQADDGEAPDPEVRRRIEELAARQDFHDEAGQRELRDLVSQVVAGISQEEGSTTSRRRLG